jgi:hypothetical protein
MVVPSATVLRNRAARADKRLVLLVMVCLLVQAEPAVPPVMPDFLQQTCQSRFSAVPLIEGMASKAELGKSTMALVAFANSALRRNRKGR